MPCAIREKISPLTGWRSRAHTWPSVPASHREQRETFQQPAEKQGGKPNKGRPRCHPSHGCGWSPCRSSPHHTQRPSQRLVDFQRTSSQSESQIPAYSSPYKLWKISITVFCLINEKYKNYLQMKIWCDYKLTICEMRFPTLIFKYHKMNCI